MKTRYIVCDYCHNEQPFNVEKEGIKEASERLGWTIWIKNIGYGAVCPDCKLKHVPFKITLGDKTIQEGIIEKEKVCCRCQHFIRCYTFKGLTNNIIGDQCLLEKQKK